MAIVLAGDFDSDKTIALIDKYFAYMQPKEVPAFSFKPEAPRNAPEEISIVGPDAENIMIGYRLPGVDSKEARLLMLMDMLLSNSKSGFIDLNLVKKQAVLSAGSSFWTNKDYCIAFLQGKPKKDQSLEDLKNLLLAQVEKVKKGEFEEAELKAIIDNLKVYKIKERESNDGRATVLLDAFITGRNWADASADLSELDKITKAELVAFANTYYANDYVVIYKRNGEDKTTQKIEKPQITPVAVNRDEVSPFVKNMTETPSPKIAPQFVDFKKDINFGQLGWAQVLQVQNTDNELFQLYYLLFVIRLILEVSGGMSTLIFERRLFQFGVLLL
jgi:predicted Zn-dependent peptidase